MNDSDLARLLALEGKGRGQRRWTCPDEERLAAYVDGHLAPEAQEHLERHLVGCDFCLGQVGFLLRQPEAAMPADVPEALLRRASALTEERAGFPARPMLRWGTAAVAAACLVLVLATNLRRQIPVPPEPSSPAAPVAPIPSTRSAPTAQPSPPRAVRSLGKVSRELQVVHPREGDVLGPGDVVFRWRPVPGALYYQVRVVTEEGDVVWEERLEGTQLTAPSDLHLVAGQGFFLRVRAYLPDGKAITSRVVGFKTQRSGEPSPQ